MRALEGGLSRQQVNGLESLITSIENDPYVTQIEWAAYMLATVRHETARTYQPIHEYGGRAYFIRRYGSQTRVGRRLGNDTPEEGAIYAGRGDVQLTGEDNYEKAEAALRQYYPNVVADFEARTGRRFDLTVGDQPGDDRDPDNAQDPAIAYAIMSFGMRTGLFTTKKLSDYTLGNAFDAVQARRIINGLDDAALIAGYYREILAILRRSLLGAVPAVTQAAFVQPVSESAAAIADPTPMAETPAGDPPNAPPSKWFNVEDWKPLVFRWLKRIWGGNLTANAGQTVANLVAAVKDPEHWYIYVAIAAGVLILLVGAGMLVSLPLIVVWLWNRREILHLKTAEFAALADPNKKNIGLLFEKK